MSRGIAWHHEDMATAQIPFRAPEEELDRIRRRARERGLSVNEYMRRQLLDDRDDRDTAVRNSIGRTYARLAQSPEFDALDEQLAALPRPASADLGFDPEAVDETAAA
jgi:hypothetical protein